MLKKVFLCMTCALFLVISNGCNTKQEGKPIELTPGEVLAKLQNNKQNSFLLYLTSEDCYSCEQYEKVIESIEDETPFEIYYLTIDLNETDKDIKNTMEELEITTGDLQELPTTYYFYQGNLLPENKKEGYLEKKDLIKWLKDLHILH